MNVLVTGGAGFIGSSLVRSLAGDGHAVRVLDDLSTGRQRNLDGVGGDPVLEGDIRDRAAVAKAVDGVEVVYHLAALPSVARSVADPRASHAVNVDGTLNLLRAASRGRGPAGRVRLVVVGLRRHRHPAQARADAGVPAVAVRRGQAGRRGLLPGLHPCLPAGDGLPPVLQRVRSPPGPGLAVRGRGPPVRQQHAGRLPPEVYGDGHQSRDFTFVANAVEACRPPPRPARRRPARR